jgi:hypothetical protein
VPLRDNYDVGERMDAATARQCLDRATNFMNVCAGRFGFAPPLWPPLLVASVRRRLDKRGYR